MANFNTGPKHIWDKKYPVDKTDGKLEDVISRTCTHCGAKQRVIFSVGCKWPKFVNFDNTGKQIFQGSSFECPRTIEGVKPAKRKYKPRKTTTVRTIPEEMSGKPVKINHVDFDKLKKFAEKSGTIVKQQDIIVIDDPYKEMTNEEKKNAEVKFDSFIKNRIEKPTHFTLEEIDLQIRKLQQRRLEVEEQLNNQDEVNSLEFRQLKSLLQDTLTILKIITGEIYSQGMFEYFPRSYKIARNILESQKMFVIPKE